MATYALYRHIELDKVGCGKKRVLKPPGGGSSDIFGSPEPPASHSLRKTRNYEQAPPSGTVMNGTKSPVDSTPSSTTSSTGNLSHSDNSINTATALNGAALDPKSEDVVDLEPTENGSVSSLEQSVSECKIESETTSSETESVTKKYVRSDSHSRIFGDNSDPEAESKNSSPSPTNNGNGPALNGSESSAPDKTDGNPVTGDGYDTTSQKETRTTSSAPVDKPRQRVPPGGYSSGLW